MLEEKYRDEINSTLRYWAFGLFIGLTVCLVTFLLYLVVFIQPTGMT
jgi:hypothetical protein